VKSLTVSEKWRKENICRKRSVATFRKETGKSKFPNLQKNILLNMPSDFSEFQPSLMLRNFLSTLADVDVDSEEKGAGCRKCIMSNDHERKACLQ
jgi:hypothetical protein